MVEVNLNMKTLEILPHIGVGSTKFGMTSTEVQKAILNP